MNKVTIVPDGAIHPQQFDGMCKVAGAILRAQTNFGILGRWVQHFRVLACRPEGVPVENTMISAYAVLSPVVSVDIDRAQQGLSAPAGEKKVPGEEMRIGEWNLIVLGATSVEDLAKGVAFGVSFQLKEQLNELDRKCREARQVIG